MGTEKTRHNAAPRYVFFFLCPLFARSRRRVLTHHDRWHVPTGLHVADHARDGSTAREAEDVSGCCPLSKSAPRCVFQPFFIQHDERMLAQFFAARHDGLEYLSKPTATLTTAVTSENTSQTLGSVKIARLARLGAITFSPDDCNRPAMGRSVNHLAQQKAHERFSCALAAFLPPARPRVPPAGSGRRRVIGLFARRQMPTREEGGGALRAGILRP